MGQLLLTLTRVLLKIPVDSLRISLTHYAASTAMLIIGGEVASSSIKPAVQVLEHFLNKHVLGAEELALMAASSQTVQVKLSPQKAVQEELRSISRSKKSREFWISSVEKLVSIVLAWVKFPDVAPVAGRFLFSFFQSLQSEPVKYDAEYRGYTGLPLWCSPVKQALENQPNLLEAFKNHIIPDLLRLNSDDTQAFQRQLPLLDLQEGIIETHATSDVQLCLLTLKIGVEAGLYKASRMYHPVYH